MSQKIDIRERRYNGVDYDILHPETNINMVLDSSNNSVGDVNGALYGDGNGNIVGAAISNPNLLDNPWFTVNQRGATSGSANGDYIADRWTVSYGLGGVTWSRTDDTITFQSTTGLSSGYLMQYLEEKLYNSLSGKIVTLSVMLGDYSILSATTTNFETYTSFTMSLNNDAQGNETSCTFYNTTKLLRIKHEKTPITIRAIKLELGSVSTLGNDVAPDYTTELLKCQKYFRRYSCTSNASPLCFGYVTSTTNIRAILPISVPMARVPTISYVGSIRANSNGDKEVTAITLDQITPQGASLNLTITGGTQHNMAYVYLQTSSSYIDISADL